MVHEKIDGSTNVASTAHEGAVMEVTYHHGGTYQYSPVSPSKYQEIRNAPSVGKAINALGIRGVKK